MKNEILEILHFKKCLTFSEILTKLGDDLIKKEQTIPNNEKYHAHVLMLVLHFAISIHGMYECVKTQMTLEEWKLHLFNGVGLFLKEIDKSSDCKKEH